MMSLLFRAIDCNQMPDSLVNWIERSTMTRKRTLLDGRLACCWLVLLAFPISTLLHIMRSIRLPFAAILRTLTVLIGLPMLQVDGSASYTVIIQPGTDECFFIRMPPDQQNVLRYVKLAAWKRVLRPFAQTRHACSFGKWEL